jgi:hypothetical protein
LANSLTDSVAADCDLPRAMKRFLGQVMPRTHTAIFTSQRSGNSIDYPDTAEHVVALAEQQPGFIVLESVRDEGGLGI